MRRFFLLLISITISQSVYSDVPEHCQTWPDWLRPVCQRPYETWTEGDLELYVPGYAWHNRYKYSEEKIKTYNEWALGGGLGKGFYDEKGDWHGLYAFVFLESHSKLEPIAGYAFLKTLHMNDTTSAGLGFTVFLTARPDILNNAPFPGILPWASLTYRKIAFLATYIPGAQDVGNVLFLLAKYTF